MVLYVKNMVCDRCKMVVKAELEKLGFKVLKVELGEITLDREISPDLMPEVTMRLENLGFAIIDDKRSRLVGQIKSLIIELVHQQNNNLRVNLSEYLSSMMHHDYNYLTAIFSESEGMTIEKYYIAQKIEKVKELLKYDELSLSEIAFQLNYSSVAHLSSQFKKVTGLTPSFYKNMKMKIRKPLDEI